MCISHSIACSPELGSLGSIIPGKSHLAHDLNYLFVEGGAWIFIFILENSSRLKAHPTNPWTDLLEYPNSLSSTTRPRKVPDIPMNPLPSFTPISEGQLPALVQDRNPPPLLHFIPSAGRSPASNILTQLLSAPGLPSSQSPKSVHAVVTALSKASSTVAAVECQARWVYHGSEGFLRTSMWRWPVMRFLVEFLVPTQSL